MKKNVALIKAQFERLDKGMVDYSAKKDAEAATIQAAINRMEKKAYLKA